MRAPQTLRFRVWKPANSREVSGKREPTCFVDLEDTEMQTPMPYSFGLARCIVASLGYRMLTRMGLNVEYYCGMRQSMESQCGRANRTLIGFNFGFWGAGGQPRTVASWPVAAWLVRIPARDEMSFKPEKIGE